MWQRLMDLLPDWHSGGFEFRDLLNLVMTGLGAYLAWVAIKMGRKQEQIAIRQSEIAEIQHKIMQEQLDRRAILKVTISPALSPDEEIYYDLNICNTGTKPAAGSTLR